MPSDLNVLVCVKGTERYVWLYDDADVSSVMTTLGRFAADPELSFTWYDAAVCSQRVRQERAKAQRRPSSLRGSS
jgi:hypothetical protein